METEKVTTSGLLDTVSGGTASVGTVKVTMGGTVETVSLGTASVGTVEVTTGGVLDTVSGGTASVGTVKVTMDGTVDTVSLGTASVGTVKVTMDGVLDTLSLGTASVGTGGRGGTNELDSEHVEDAVSRGAVNVSVRMVKGAKPCVTPGEVAGGSASVSVRETLGRVPEPSAVVGDSG